MLKANLSLTAEEIREAVFNRLKRYEGLNFLEQLGIYLGIAQIIELTLKQFLHQKYGVNFESLERKTLGQVARLLAQHGVRADFVALLDAVVVKRNHIAHELLVNQFLLIEMGAGGARFEVRVFEHAIYELEQLWFLFEWTETHDLWN